MITSTINKALNPTFKGTYQETKNGKEGDIVKTTPQEDAQHLNKIAVLLSNYKDIALTRIEEHSHTTSAGMPGLYITSMDFLVKSAKDGKKQVTINRPDEDSSSFEVDNLKGIKYKLTLTKEDLGYKELKTPLKNIEVVMANLLNKIGEFVMDKLKKQ